MYYIDKQEDGWHCTVVIQDGTERFVKETKRQAIESVIQAARTLNHAYISVKDIIIEENTQIEITTTTEDDKLLQQIKSKHLIPLSFDDPRIVYRITPEECELVQKIREGEIILKSKNTGRCINIHNDNF